MQLGEQRSCNMKCIERTHKGWKWFRSSAQDRRLQWNYMYSSTHGCKESDSSCNFILGPSILDAKSVDRPQSLNPQQFTSIQLPEALQPGMRMGFAEYMAKDY